MKRTKCNRSFLIVLATLLVAFMFTACDFFSYEKGTTADEIDYRNNLEQMQTKYIDALNCLSSEDAYYEAERKVYVLCLLEGINEIRDCDQIELLDSIFEIRKEAILSIKTIDQYEEEERQKSEQLENAKKEYLAKLNAISAEENYREAELVTYRFYLEVATDEISNCEEQELLEEIFNTYREVIVSIKTVSEYEAEEAVAFAAFCEGKKQEIRNHLMLSEYRKEQADEIRALIAEYEKRVGEATEYDAVENIVREFKVMVYSIKTDQELYAEELSAAISEAVDEMNRYVNVLDYRENEAKTVKAILSAFNGQVAVAQTKEAVADLLATYKSMLDSVKTDAVLYNEERLQLVEDGYLELLDIIDLDSMEEEWAEAYREHCNRVKEEMIALSTKEEVLEKLSAEKKAAYLTGAQANDPRALKSYQQILISDIDRYNDETKYREEQRRELLTIRNSFAVSVMRLSTYDETMVLFESTLLDLDGILTNDEMWQMEDDEFRSTLRELYGEFILAEPKSLTEANNYFELAEIIDYYAFYQINGGSFVRDKFRVKLNYNHGNANDEINSVYWHCELLRSGAGIYGSIEDRHYLVCTLIPYELASTSNRDTTDRITRKESLVQYKKSNDNQSIRENHYDAFPYKNYAKSLYGIWNTQQLWYALEHKYLPFCIPDTSADLTLKKAKQILREIVREGMSDEEKIFAIYSWFGDNVQYDHQYVGDFYQSVLQYYPEAATSRAFHVEGSLIDGLAVCEGYAKAYLLLLRLEGIESYRIVMSPATRGQIISDPQGEKYYSGGYGSHAFVGIRMSDGKLYYSDTEQTFVNGMEYLQMFQQFMVPPSLFVGYSGSTFLLPNIPISSSVWKGYKNFELSGVSLFIVNKVQLDAALKSIIGIMSTKPNLQISIFSIASLYPNLEDDLLSFITFDVINRKSSDQSTTFVEYILYT